MKKLTFLVLALITMSLIVGCGSEKKADEKKEDTSKSKKKIALIMKTLTNPFFVEMEKGARKAEQEFGFTLIVKTGAKETSVDQQIALVEDMIKDKVDAIVIAPADSTQLLPVIKKAQEAGILIVNVDNIFDAAAIRQLGMKEIPYVTVDNEAGAYSVGKYLAGLITKPTDVAILEGITTAKNAEQRKNGALKAFKENPNINVVATQTANWKIDEAKMVTADLYKKYPDIGAWFCANDMMALGTLQYLDEVKKSGVLVAGYDNLEDARKAIVEGKMVATVDQDAPGQAYKAMQLALDLIAGKKVPQETIVPTKLITKDNL